MGPALDLSKGQLALTISGLDAVLDAADQPQGLGDSVLDILYAPNIFRTDDGYDRLRHFDSPFRIQWKKLKYPGELILIEAGQRHQLRSFTQ